jgi:type IV pilus assembly protein PilP
VSPHPFLRAGLVVGLALTGCGGDSDSAPAPAAPKAPQKAATAPTAPQESTTQFSYSPVGKRDPFYSYLADLQNAVEAPTQRTREPTETYELDQYRLTGLVTGTAQPRAMVEDPEGKGHVISIGTRLGKRGGVVTRIAGEGIIVTEEFRTPTGDKVRVPITVKLPQPELEMGSGQ